MRAVGEYVVGCLLLSRQSHRCLQQTAVGVGHTGSVVMCGTMNKKQICLSFGLDWKVEFYTGSLKHDSPRNKCRLPLRVFPPLPRPTSRDSDVYGWARATRAHAPRMEFAGVRRRMLMLLSLPTHEHASRRPHAANPPGYGMTGSTGGATTAAPAQTHLPRGGRTRSVLWPGSAGARLTSADAGTHMHCDSTRKPTV